MEFPFPISKALELKQDGFTMLCSSDFMKDSSVSSVASFDEQEDVSTKYLPKIIDMLGEMISQIQDTPANQMTYNKFTKKDDRKMYIKADLHKIYGFLLVKVRDSEDRKGRPQFLVKDFFVHESVQRTGVGQSIFEYFLDMEEVQAVELMYKNPTEPLFAFLEKFYGLSTPIPQLKGCIRFDASKIVENYESAGANPRISPEMEDLDEIVNASPQFKNRSIEKKKTGRRDGLRSNKLNETDVSIIDKLLKAPSLLESNIISQKQPPEIKYYENIENSTVKKFYEEIFKWHWNLEQEIAQEEKYFQSKLFVKSDK